MLVGAAAHECRYVASHVPRTGVGSATSHRDHVGDSPGSVGAQVLSSGKARLDQLRSDKVGIGHAEGLDDLAERRKAVVAVHEPGARLGIHAETDAVILGELALIGALVDRARWLLPGGRQPLLTFELRRAYRDSCRIVEPPDREGSPQARSEPFVTKSVLAALPVKTTSTTKDPYASSTGPLRKSRR